MVTIPEIDDGDHPFHMRELVHGVDEFHNVPWNKLKAEGCTRDWTFGRGGHGLPEGTWTIQTHSGKYSNTWHYWVVPEAIGAMLEMKARCDVNRAKREIRNAFQDFLGSFEPEN